MESIKKSIRARKRFSQNFLTNRTIARRIVESVGIGQDDHILEIGPGKGILTQYLLDSPAKEIIAVEIDHRLVEWLKSRFGENGRFRLLEKDFLEVNLCSMTQEGGKLRLVGNIPYAITSPILFHILENRRCVGDFTVTVQKEVGERITSPPGRKSYGIPSILFQLLGRMEMVFPISRREFDPVPEVDSVVVRCSFYETPLHEIRDILFFRHFLKTIFNQRRKMLRNTIKNLSGSDAVLRNLEFDLCRRPEDLTVEELVRLCNDLHEQMN